MYKPHTSHALKAVFGQDFFKKCEGIGVDGDIIIANMEMVKSVVQHTLDSLPSDAYETMDHRLQSKVLIDDARQPKDVFFTMINDKNCGYKELEYLYGSQLVIIAKRTPVNEVIFSCYPIEAADMVNSDSFMFSNEAREKATEIFDRVAFLDFRFEDGKFIYTGCDFDKLINASLGKEAYRTEIKVKKPR